MKELTVFYLETCPYCKNARKALAQLMEENDRYKSTPVKWVEESRNAELADHYDYYRVPSIFCGEEKLYEASPSQDFFSIKESIRKVLDAAL